MEIALIVLAVGWLLRILIEEGAAALGGRESPSIARRRAREQLARDCGATAVVQAFAARAVKRIENPPDRRWVAALRDLFNERWDDAVTEAKVRHRYAHETRMRAAAARRNRTSPPQRPPGERVQAEAAREDPVETWPCRDACGMNLDEPDTWCDDCRVRLDICQCGLAPMQVAGPEQVIHDYPQAFVTWRCPACGVEDYRDVQLEPDEPDPYRLAFGHTYTEPCTCDTDEPDPDPVTDPPAAPPGDGAPPEKETPMSAATHPIVADCRDPRTSLAFATQCRGWADAGVAELDIFASVVREMGISDEPVNVLADAVRSCSSSVAKSIEVYARHVITQRELYQDEAIREAVRGYLRMDGADAGMPPAPQGAVIALSAADCRTPERAQWFMEEFAEAFAALRGSVDTVRGQHERQRVGDDAVVFLEEQRDLYAVVEEQALDCAAEFARQVAIMRDRIAADPSLAGTQDGGWLEAPVAG